MSKINFYKSFADAAAFALCALADSIVYFEQAQGRLEMSVQSSKASRWCI